MIHTGDERSIREADLVVLSVGTLDSEAVDRSFDLPKDQENLINWVLRVEQEYPYSDQFRRGNKYEPLDR